MRVRWILLVGLSLPLVSWACGSDSKKDDAGGTAGSAGSGGTGGDGGTSAGAAGGQGGTSTTGGSASGATGGSATGGTGGDLDAGSDVEQETSVELLPNCIEICDRATIACDWDDTISLRCRYDCSLNIETHECGSLIADAIACGLDKPVICQGNDEYIVEGCDDELMAVGTCFEENDSGE